MIVVLVRVQILAAALLSLSLHVAVDAARFLDELVVPLVDASRMKSVFKNKRFRGQWICHLQDETVG
jgi:hypothetical protein